MQSGFVKAICQMGTFMICAQAIVHFRPKAAYEKYLKMLVSAMILMQLFLSVSGVFTSNKEEGLAQRAEWFAESMEESMRQAAELSFFPETADVKITGEQPETGQDGEWENGDEQRISVEIAPIPSVSVEAVQEIGDAGEGGRSEEQ